MAIETSLPSRFAAGTTVKYTKAFASYPASAGWELKLYLRGASAPAAIVATANGNSFDVEIPATVTDDLIAGLYRWAERVTLGAEAYDAANGTVTVDPDLATAGAGALQTTEEKALAALIARRDARLTADQESVQIDGIAIARIPFEDLERYIGIYQAKVNAQRRGGALRTIPIAFTRPS